jgi:general secretion pathway protein C
LAVKDPTAGLAILGPSPTDAHVFATGSDVVPGIRLVEVYADHVVIDRGGIRESVVLPHSGNGAPVAAAHPALADVARQVAAAPEVIGDLMRPMPNYVAGQLRGFKLFPGRDRKRFEQLGLQPGDMVTQVNGVPIKDAQHGLEMLQSLGSSTSTLVTVERGGVIQSVTIDSSQLANLADPSRPATGPVPAPIVSDPNNE